MISASNTTGTRPFTDPRWFAVNKTVIRYTRKDSVGSIVRTFPKGTRRKPPVLRLAKPISVTRSVAVWLVAAIRF